jgi:F-type H+-transporting ATPase subunit delta
MSISRISSRYAKSLLDLAVEGNTTEQVMNDIQAFSKMLESRDLQLLLKSPIVSSGKKSDIFKALFEGKFSQLTMAFLNIILNKGREEFLPQIAEDFILQYKEAKGITDVKLTTAAKVPDALLDEIKSKLMDSDATSEKVEISTDVNPNLIGGFVVEIGDKLYDDSIAHKLNEIKKQFASNNYIK